MEDRDRYIEVLSNAQSKRDDIGDFLSLCCDRQLDSLKETLEVAATSAELMNIKSSACKAAMNALNQ